MRVALATCAAIPEPDADAEILIEAIRPNVNHVAWVAWDGPTTDPADLVVLRSTWNYYHRVDAFLAWVDAVSAHARVLNPPDVVRWNAHKRYLVDLVARGIPTVPTELVPKGSTAPLESILEKRAWSRAVIKPAVSAASFRTACIARPVDAAARAHFATILDHGDALVQPYVDAVESSGERSIVWIDGAITHSVRKSPRFGRDRESVSGIRDVASDERALAEAALAPWRDRLLYARVDMVRGDDGRPMIMELELIEPSLFLAKHPPALARLAAAIVRG